MLTCVDIRNYLLLTAFEVHLLEPTYNLLPSALLLVGGECRSSLLRCRWHKHNLLNPSTAAIRRSGYKLFVKWRRYPTARVEHNVQNGAVIRMASFTHRPSV